VEGGLTKTHDEKHARFRMDNLNGSGSTLGEHEFVRSLKMGSKDLHRVYMEWENSFELLNSV